MRIFINLCTKILPKPKIPPKSLDSSQSIVTKTWNLMFGRYLLATNVISSGVIMCAGDLMSQKLENYMVIGDDSEQNANNDDGVIRKRKKVKKEIDWERMGYMFIAGALQGPINHYVYKYLDIFLPKSDLRTVAKKIAIDQFMMSPVCIVAFFYSAGLLEKKTVSECTAELKEKALTVYTADWLVWPPTQFINFYYLPTQYRVFYVNIVTMLYNVFLSYTKHNDITSLSPFKHQ